MTSIQDGGTIYLVQANIEKNANKFYKIERSGDKLNCSYGRVGENRQQTKQYDIRRFHKLYSTKIRKGYVDHTGLFEVKDKEKVVNAYTDAVVQEFYEFLVNFQTESVQSALSVDVNNLTINHVVTSEAKLSRISEFVAANKIDEANELLEEQFTIIPRFIDRRAGVKSSAFNDDTERNKSILEKEYELLDNLKTVINSKPDSTVADSIVLPYELKRVDDTQAAKLIDRYNSGLVSDYKNTRVKTVFEVTVPYKQYDDQRRDKLLWHGSGNANWNSILSNGLKIRPPGIPTTGAMFGNGIYFADLSQKSIGYTSIHGSYWGGGRSDRAILALYAVCLGNVLTDDGTSYHKTVEDAVSRGYNSLWVQGKANSSKSRLWNDEIIIPNPKQVIPKYIFDIEL